MAYTIEQVVERHRELKAQQAVISARHAEEMNPINESIAAIETWLLAKMNQDGVDSYKTPHGTAYQSRLKSVKMEDPIAFKHYVLRPAAQKILEVAKLGYVAEGDSYSEDAVLSILDACTLWDLADFRPGKKGIQKHQEDTGSTVPGIKFSEIINVNVRGS